MPWKMPEHWLQHPREWTSVHPTAFELRWELLTPWEKFRFWVEQDAMQLGMELTTYYGVCSIAGLVQAFTLAVAMGLIHGPL